MALIAKLIGFYLYIDVFNIQYKSVWNFTYSFKKKQTIR